MLAKFQKSAYRLLMKISAGWDEDIMSLMNVYASWDEDIMSLMNVYAGWGCGNSVSFVIYTLACNSHSNNPSLSIFFITETMPPVKYFYFNISSIYRPLPLY